MSEQQKDLMRTEYRLEPMELADMVKQGEIPKCVLLCEGGDFRSAEVAFGLRKIKGINAVAVKYGIAGLENKNPYNHIDKHLYDFSEEDQTKIINNLARIPAMILILDSEERRDYNKMIAALEVAVKKNQGKFFLTKDINEAYSVMGVK